MGKISDYTRVLVSKLTDVFACDQTDNGTTETKSATVEQIGTAIGTLQNFADLDTSNKNLVDAINEIASYTPVYGNTASGAIATFDTSLALPLQDCTIAINAVQTGTLPPSPSNVCPISGFTGANIKVVGANLWNEEWEVGGIDGATGLNNSATNTIRSKNYIPVMPNTALYILTAGYNTWVYEYGIDNTFLTRTLVNNATFTPSAKTFYLRFMPGTTYGTTYNNDISINYPATDTAYHAYNANSTTAAITWNDEAGTVYGGSLDVTSGKLTIDYAGKTFDGTDAWSNYSGGNGYAIAISDMKSGTHYSDDKALCNEFEKVSDNTNLGIRIGVANKNIYVVQANTLTGVSDLATWHTWLSNNPLTVVYPLATPITYQLTPTQIQTIVSGGSKTTNNIFCDTNGNTSVVFACSLKDYIDSQ